MHARRHPINSVDQKAEDERDGVSKTKDGGEEKHQEGGRRCKTETYNRALAQVRAYCSRQAGGVGGEKKKEAKVELNETRFLPRS